MPAADVFRPLQGRVALVLAATTPEASTAAEALAAAGAKVLLNYLYRRQEAERLAERIRRRQGQAMIFQADVSQTGQLISMCDVLAAYWGSLDILVDDSGFQAESVLAVIGPERASAVACFDCVGVFRYLAGLAGCRDDEADPT
ncbi:MAG: SDR family oxidoreductase [Methylomonas sp.]|jgi:NAD(P)-dependent dehydrogenase (short-subunit alcohol dehydrogenase family)|uniref:SDR family oxidoreductase n=1 Tax=Methylomonas sp. TaxID=418 RepID=UPI0025EDFA75|nr:SDR family oxidoreductase [Methylomonas sp.]MCK9605467.1 SDR family oxidoreductase [Methylomonas sp.]